MSLSTVGNNFLTVANFSTYEPELLDLFIGYGIPGAELRTGVRKRMAKPVQYTMNPDQEAFPGEIVSDYDLNAARTKLSDRGYKDFDFDRQQHAHEVAACDVYAGKLSVRLLQVLSAQSKASLDTKGGPTGWDAAKSETDTFRMWELIVEAHRSGSAKVKQLYLSELIGIKQTTTHESLLSTWNRAMLLFVQEFGSKEYPGLGLIDGELLLQSMYVNAVDPVFFHTVIERFIMSPDPDETLSSLQDKFQRYALSYGSPSVPAVAAVPLSDFSGTALVAAASSVALASAPVLDDSSPPKLFTSPAPPRYALGPHDPNSEFCSHCWSKGYKSTHPVAGCDYYLAYRAYLKRSKRPTASTATSSKSVPDTNKSVPDTKSDHSAFAAHQLMLVSPGEDESSKRQFIDYYESNLKRYQQAVRDVDPDRYLHYSTL